MPTSGHVKARTEYLEATLGLVKCLEISKELICECVTVPGCCCCMPLLYNHLMDLCSYVHKNKLLAAKGGCSCAPLTPPKSTTEVTLPDFIMAPTHCTPCKYKLLPGT